MNIWQKFISDTIKRKLNRMCIDKEVMKLALKSNTFQLLLY